MMDHKLKALFEEGTWIEAVFSNPRSKTVDVPTKITMRPVKIKQRLCYQVSAQLGTKVLHQNLSYEEGLRFILEDCLRDYKQGLLFTQDSDYHLLTNRKGETTLLKKPPTKVKKALEHNIAKKYLIPEGEPLPFLVELGIMNAAGKVLPQKYDKFRQINRFLEMVRDILPAFEGKEKLYVIDFGCGKGYLTFGLYYYLHNVLGYQVEIKGIDLKADVMALCQEVARKVGYEGLTFCIGDISGFVPSGPVDMVVALHACDTATDAALAQAVHWQATVILSAPCCQHELYSQVRNASLQVLLQHGILKERFAALATDAARAKLLETQGYKVQLLEFIDPEHTPKNLLIRAVRELSEKQQKEALQSYQEFKAFLGINPCLERLLQKN